MSANFQPTGMNPVGRTGGPHTGQARKYDITADIAVALAVREPVALVGGTIKSLAATPTTTLGVNTPVGVVAGFEYTDAARGFVTSQLLPANATTAGLKKIAAYVYDDPSIEYLIQANGAITQAMVGNDIALGGLAATDVVMKTSRAYADSATVSSSTSSVLALKIVGIDRAVDNAAGDAKTVIKVKWNAGVQRFAEAGAE